MTANKWIIEDTKFEVNNVKETIFTLANGKIGVRGTHEELFEAETPGTYVAGIFDKSEAQVKELVNLPYFWGLRIYIGNEFLNPLECEILDYKRHLNMKEAAIYRYLKVKDKKGRITIIRGIKFLSFKKRNLALAKYEITPENYDEKIYIEHFIDGTTKNSKKNPAEKVKHYKLKNTKVSNDYIYTEAHTRESHYKVSIISFLDCRGNKISKDLDDSITQTVEIFPKKGEKFSVTVYTSIISNREIENLFTENLKELNKAKDMGFEKLFDEHKKELERLWKIANIDIEGDEKADKALRFNIFVLLSMGNPDDEKVSIAAKGLHGEGYKGHVFWDTEIYMLPFYIYVYPKAARAMLMYRYHTLQAAINNARKNGYKGAQYPWESADTGEEETPKWGEDYYGNKVRIWTGDIEYHITADVAVAIVEYLKATNDWDFFLNYGFEILLETARFWSSRVEFNSKKERYEINNVIGPDEFHEHVNNNFYTNFLAKWNILKAIEYTNFVKNNYPKEYEKTIKKVGLTEKEIKHWKEVANKLYIPWDKKSHLIEQFEGYFNLEDKKITEFDEKNMPVWPKGVDLSNLNNYQLIKQPDVIMAMFVLPQEFDDITKKVNYEYYEQRTMHKSSLSPSIYAILGLTIGNHEKAYQHFMRTALVDLENNQGNTEHGIHAASAGGTWQAAIFGFGGMRIENDTLSFHPWLPKHWKSMSYKIIFKENIYNVFITNQNVKITKIPYLK
ncbi:glycoside hydrolase family 65 protein [Thermosipho atlanticus]|uniref:Kojibiose phosphorylase n=1 Tax=Thermosipho atlanticus DSM 15807 TaxID=1123380 RepID=A0A1M5TB77_9BACT|nr:glycosyl hydrolase family 65 protein [Thermosipho atlanticus]SHH47951.1 kojibiose phosphorylase [Thermosipho atlanticus DSM 15807]